jgi:hypothetical protein
LRVLESPELLDQICNSKSANASKALASANTHHIASQEKSMTRNAKRFLAVSLLSLTPSIALAEQYEFGDLDFLSQRSEYVSDRTEVFEIPVLRDAPSQSVGPALQDFYVNNLSSLAYFAGYILTGTVHQFPPSPLAPTTTGRFLISAPTPPVTQSYYYTDTPTNPSAGKTCAWQVVISVTNGLCTGQVTTTRYGTAICGVVAGQSTINPNTCQTQIVTTMQ